MCAFHSGSYTSFFIRQFLNTVPVKLKKWYFAALWRLWQKVKYPEIKPRKKHSKKLLSDVCIHLRELKLTLHCSAWKLCLWWICEGIFSGTQSLMVRKCLPMKTGEKLLEQLICDVCIHLIELNHSLDWAVWNHCFCGTWERTFGNALKNMLKQKYPPTKTRRKLSVKLLCVMWITLAQLSFSFHGALF